MIALTRTCGRLSNNSTGLRRGLGTYGSNSDVLSIFDSSLGDGRGRFEGVSSKLPLLPTGRFVLAFGS